MHDHDVDPFAAAERRKILSSVLTSDTFEPLSAVVTVEFGSHSRPGIRRAINTDHFAILRIGRSQEVIATTLPAADLRGRFDEYGYAMVVADGAGNDGSGSLASRVAISTLAHLAIHCGNWNLRVDASTAESIMSRAEWFYERAAHAVDRHSLSNQDLAGMCTTLTAVFTAGDQLFFAHVGHSRAYLFRDGQLTQLTRDHTLEQRLNESLGPVPVPSARFDVRNILTDAIGAGGGPPAVDVERFHLSDGDSILLCTDGLTQALDDDVILDVLTHPRDLNEQCRHLVDLAMARGGDDDATALIARYRIPSAL